MKPVITCIFSLLLIGGAAVAHPATASIPTSGAHFSDLAAQAARSGQPRVELFYLEQAMRRSVGQMAVFGPLEGRYWRVIKHRGDYDRALNFYAALKATHPRDPEVLANYASALGGVLGWLNAQGVNIPKSLDSAYTREAMANYRHALAIQPDNFSARLGQAIWYSYLPRGMSQSDSAFRHLLALRKGHPYYPYALVYRQWAAALRRNGENARAEQVLKSGKAKLGEQAFDRGH